MKTRSDEMTLAPPGYSMQPISLADVPRLTRFANAYARRFSGRSAMSEKRMELMLTAPGMNLAESARWVLGPDGNVAGAGFVFHRDPHVMVFAWGLVGEQHMGVGIGRRLHDWILDRSRAVVDLAPDDARVVLIQNTFAGDEAAEAFLRATGYSVTRHYWRMAIEFDRPPPVPEWPSGIDPADFDADRDLEAIVHASREAFRDHYGMVAGSFEEEVERTRHWIERDPTFDPSLQFLARGGDEIAGFCFCSPNEAGDETTGYVQSLGVRPAWRRRGLGRALLLHAFGEFHRRATEGVALHVDSESLTGATRLYESVGMRVTELSHRHELELRPGVDLTTQTFDT
jgi:ribosomal protein S18 acetylase RimI-like enzyme